MAPRHDPNDLTCGCNTCKKGKKRPRPQRKSGKSKMMDKKPSTACKNDQSRREKKTAPAKRKRDDSNSASCRRSPPRKRESKSSSYNKSSASRGSRTSNRQSGASSGGSVKSAPSNNAKSSCGKKMKNAKKIPKKVSPYIAFFMECWEKQKNQPNIKLVDVAKQCGKCWRNMSQDQKDRYKSFCTICKTRNKCQHRRN